MNKNVKYTVIGLLVCAVISFALYFLIGNKTKEYIVAFDTAGGSSISSQTIKEGEKVIKPDNPTRENYTFVKWTYDNIEYDFNQTVEKDMTLKAIWEEVVEVNKYDIIFIVDGVEKTLSLETITESDLDSLGFEEKEGYILKWYINDKEYDFSTPLTSNMTLTGKYEKTTMYTVKFNSDGGTAVTSQKVNKNETVKEPDPITKYGFIFDGWYLNNTKYDFSTPVTKNITLVAKWKEDESIQRYEVTFDSDGGSKVDKQRIIENQVAKEPKAPTKSGYKFLGWYVGDKKYDFKTKVTANVTLKAKWEKIIQYTVTFDKDNGSNNDTVTVNSGDKVAKPKDPTKTGYKFSKWLYENKEFDFNTPITKDMTLQASYNALNKYTVTFDSAGGSVVASQSVYEGSKATKPSNPTRSDYDFVKWTLNGSEYKFDSVVTKDITLVAEWKAKTYNYKVIATRVDNYSPDSILKLYKNNSSLSYKSIIVAGISLAGPDAVVNTESLKGKLNGGTSVRVKLTDDSEVTATIEFRQ